MLKDTKVREVLLLLGSGADPVVQKFAVRRCAFLESLGGKDIPASAEDRQETQRPIP